MTAAPRSTFVTVLAWIFIVLAGFATLISIMQNIMIAVVFSGPEMRAASQANQDKLPWLASFLFNHVYLFFLFFLVVCVTTLAAAIGLLKRRNWARVLFIIMMGFGIAWNLAGIAFMFVFSSMWKDMPVPPNQAHAPTMDVMVTVMMGFQVLMIIGFVWLFAWIIKRLVSEEIRREFLAG